MHNLPRQDQPGRLGADAIRDAMWFADANAGLWAVGNGLKHHTAMQALFVAWYNFARKNEALGGKTPAMASKLMDHV